MHHLLSTAIARVIGLREVAARSATVTAADNASLVRTYSGDPAGTIPRREVTPPDSRECRPVHPLPAELMAEAGLWE